MLADHVWGAGRVPHSCQPGTGVRHRHGACGKRVFNVLGPAVQQRSGVFPTRPRDGWRRAVRCEAEGSTNGERCGGSAGGGGAAEQQAHGVESAASGVVAACRLPACVPVFLSPLRNLLATTLLQVMALGIVLVITAVMTLGMRESAFITTCVCIQQRGGGWTHAHCFASSHSRVHTSP
jgi:hypothetical protein